MLAVGAIALVAAGLVVSAPNERAEALSGSEFDPGYIISDANFYNGSAMSEAEIQRFLQDAVGGVCNNSNCLAAYRADTPTRTWSFGTCSTYVGGANESAARIIYKVQQACKLSAKVILVTLQKEQSLVTDRAPSDGTMRKAMGYGCPDTAACDSTYYGFFNQLFAAGRQLTWYSNPDGSFTSIRIGAYNSIRYSPNASCGSKSVLVKNRATAALYYYTPYTPNAAALANLGGIGDGCSAYGNRNFWVFYNNWFGSPTLDGAAYIAAEYGAQGGPSGHLGAPTSAILPIAANGGGLGQAFQNGSIYWSPATGALTVRAGAIRDYYFRFGGAAGAIGFPTYNQATIPANGGGTAQAFTAGSIYSSAAGTFLVGAPTLAGYFAENGANGPLGWPKGDLVCGLTDGGCSQVFTGGAVYWTSKAGARAVWGPMFTAYLAAGGPGGTWGQPVSAQSYIGGGAVGGYGQAFSAGSAYHVNGGTAFFVTGSIRDTYFKLGGAAGSLGFPVGAQECSGPSCVQRFEFGAIIKDGSGTRVASPEIEAVASANANLLGASTTGLLYYPYAGGGLAQGFVGGTVYWKGDLGAFAVTGAFRDAYFARGGAAGALGWPAGSQRCISGGCAQDFQGASVYWTPGTGAYPVSSAILAGYRAAGDAVWGWPTTEPLSVPQNGGGVGQAFTKGSAYSSTAGAFFVGGPIRDRYFQLGGAAGPLGFPTAAQECGLPDGACEQRFAGGTITWSPARGAIETTGGIASAYVAAGGASGTWGTPVARPSSVAQNGGGVGQAFAVGSAYQATGGPALFVSGAIRDFYFARAGAAGSLGFPTGAVNCTSDGSSCTQTFQGGTVGWTTAGGARLL